MGFVCEVAVPVLPNRFVKAFWQCFHVGEIVFVAPKLCKKKGVLFLFGFRGLYISHYDVCNCFHD